MRMMLLLALPAVALPLQAADWTNSGGNAGRFCLSQETGPGEADPLWSGGRSSIISWQPVTMGDRLFLVRQAAWPGTPGDSPVVCMDLLTGQELWAVDIPYSTGDWITWIAGASDGLVFAARSGNGASVSARLYALDAEDGQVVWTSDDEIDAGPYDGVVFAPDGDPVVASFRDIWRIDSGDGSTVWHSPRTGSVSGQCGGCIHGSSFYVVDAVPGGHAFVRYDLGTGAELYTGPVMPGFTAQCTPMAGPDGTVYFNRSQDNPAVDFLYAFEDTGSGFVEKWHVPAANACAPEFGVGPDGSVYFVIPGPRLARVDPDDGAILQQTGVISGYSACRLAIDAEGRIFFSNGGFGGGRLYAWTADLQPLWETQVTNVNIGGPVLGSSGVLVVCGTGTDIRAWRCDTGTPGGDGPPSVLTVALHPNPSSGPLTLAIGMPGEGTLQARIYDPTGRLVATPADGIGLPRGMSTLTWDGNGPGGTPVPAGTYILETESGGLRASALLVRL